MMLIKNSWWGGLAASAAIHAAVFTVGGWALVKPVQYGVESGQGGVEVSLIAAPAELIPENISEPAPLSVEEVRVFDRDSMPLFQHQIEEKKLSEPAPVKIKKASIRQNAPVQGDGSSAVPGRSATTFHSLAGAVTEAKPDYLKNPAPAYPWTARRNGWEGTVMLKASVTADGRPTEVRVEQSSGHTVLDEAAAKTVGTWRFRPAMLGSLPIESSVRFPVRFELDSLEA